MDYIERAIIAFFDALNRGDIDEIVSLFTEDGVFMGNEIASFVGREQIRHGFSGVFETMRFDRQTHIDHIETRDDLGIARTHTTGNITHLDSNEVSSAESRELFVLRKSSEGEELWFITDYMFNRTAPAA